jgi:hypothetical protein
MLVELMCFVDSHDLQDLDELLLADLIKHGERSTDMQSIELEFEMQQLLITAMAGEWVLGKGVALLFNKPLALLRKL